MCGNGQLACRAGNVVDREEAGAGAYRRLRGRHYRVRSMELDGGPGDNDRNVSTI